MVRRMDLKEKLRQFETGFRPKERPSVVHTHGDIDKYVNGQEVVNEFGRYFRVQTDYSPETIRDDISLDQFSPSDSDIFHFVGKDERLKGLDLRKSIFFDTETTGLAGGAGTVPFMIGLGFFSEDRFCVEQYFMRDYHEERAMLYGVAHRMNQCASIISYNGKAYDLNILRSRFILARMEQDFADLPHLDLLFSARRLWRRRLGDCSLSNIEKEILHFHRSGDIPGFLIPGLYFDYLRSRDGESLKPVFHHNAWDIVSLVALAGLVARIYQNPADVLDHSLDLYSLGHAFTQMDRFEDAAASFREALRYPMEEKDKIGVMQSLGFTFKRLRRWDDAADIWEEMINASPQNILPYEELAKHYEHRLKDYEKASEVVRKGIERIEMLQTLYSDSPNKSYRENLTYRLRRLMNKQLKNR